MYDRGLRDHGIRVQVVADSGVVHSLAEHYHGHHGATLVVVVDGVAGVKWNVPILVPKSACKLLFNNFSLKLLIKVNNYMSVSSETDDIILNLMKCYLNGSLSFCLQPAEAQIMTWDSQKVFMERTVQHKLLQDYPVRNEFSKLFFKKLIGYIEPYQEVHDDMYNFLCNVMKNENANLPSCYRHYIIDNNVQNIITIMETNSMVVNGTTGMRTWEAAIMLADWALSNAEVFANKKILELGSGVGFTGINIAKHCKIKSIILTDFHNDVLNTIQKNIEINFPSQTKTNNLDVMMLDWNDADVIPSDLKPDIVIGADIVYDPSILQPLCNVVKRFFDNNDHLEVYIASMIRNEDTFNSFLQTLELNGLLYSKVPQEKSVFIDWNHHNQQRCLLKILKQ